jgi:dTMP kinase
VSISIKSRFISFEGIDGCGKSTQVKKLKEYLNSKRIKSIIVREPGGSAISEKIRRILLSKSNTEMNFRTEALLMTASRAQLTKEVILPNLDSGIWVIADRYSDSTLAYQGGGRNMDIQWLTSLNSFATFDLNPDLTFFLDIPIEMVAQRKSELSDRFEEEGISFLNKVQKSYETLLRLKQNRMVCLNGTQDIEEIHDTIIKTIKQKGFIHNEPKN